MKTEMKLSIWTAYYVEKSPEDAIREIAKCGYRYAELSDEHGAMLLERGDPTEVGRAFGEFAREMGVDIAQGHLFLRVALTEADAVPVLCRWLDLFSAIGIKSAVLHCDTCHPEEMPEEEIYEKNAAALRALVAHIQGREIRICLENLCKRWKSAEELLRLIFMVGEENLGICLDTGHLNLTRASSQGDFIRKAGHFLHALHLADNMGERDDHLIPFTAVGQIDIYEILAALGEVGYEGLCNLEIPGERKEPLPIRAAKLAYVKTCLDYALQSISE